MSYVLSPTDSSEILIFHSSFPIQVPVYAHLLLRLPVLSVIGLLKAYQQQGVRLLGEDAEL